MRIIRQTFRRYCRENLSIPQLRKLARKRWNLENERVQWYSFFYVLRDTQTGETLRITRDNFDYPSRYPCRFAPANSIIYNVCDDLTKDLGRRPTIHDLLAHASTVAQSILRTSALDKPRQKRVTQRQGGKHGRQGLSQAAC